MKLPKIPYWPLLIGPTLLFGIGFAMNAVVMAANGGQMPVLIPGGCTTDIQNALLNEEMRIHSCMTSATHLKFLADWIVIRGIGIASPGDFLEWLCEATQVPAFILWVAAMIKDKQ